MYHHHSSILNLTIYLPVPVNFIILYVFISLFGVLLFQLEELSFAFLIRQV